MLSYKNFVLIIYTHSLFTHTKNGKSYNQVCNAVILKSKDMETDKYFLIDNVTAEVKQINKNGDYIKKFNIELTGKANYSERVAKA